MRKQNISLETFEDKSAEAEDTCLNLIQSKAANFYHIRAEKGVHQTVLIMASLHLLLTHSSTKRWKSNKSTLQRYVCKFWKQILSLLLTVTY